MAATFGRRMFYVTFKRVPWTIGKNELKNYFEQFGLVDSVHLKYETETGFHRGFGYVYFRGKEDYERVLAQTNHIIDQQRFEVSAKLKDDIAADASSDAVF